MAKDVAVVLNSGSINSAVATALAAQRYRPVMLHITRGPVEESEAGEGPSSRGRIAFDQQVAHFKPFREHILPLPGVKPIKPAAGRGHAVAAELQQKESAVARPGIEMLSMIAAAAQLAHDYEATAIYIGLRVGGGVDGLGQASEYVQIWTELLQIPCGMPDLEIQAPVLELDAWQVVDLGFQLGTPFERTWSCQAAGAEEPCWACAGCRAREAAFERAAKPDPLRASSR